MCQAGERQVQRPDLSQGTEAVPEKQSRHIKGEAEGEGWRRDQNWWEAGLSPRRRREHQVKAWVQSWCRDRAEAEEPPKRPGWGWGQVLPFNRDLLLFSRSVMSNSLQPQLHHARLSCSSLSPRVCSNSCPLSQ